MTPRRTPSRTARACAAALLCAAAQAAAVPDDATRAFLWEQANTQAAAADRPEAYLKAAQTYNRLVNDGVSNGTLFSNLGAALVLAGDGANAAAAFERAERHLGATPETRQGLSAALALQAGRPHADLPWSRTALFWHYGLPCETRAWAALAGWTLFWLGALCRTHRRARATHATLRSLSDTGLLAGGLLALAFSASTAATLLLERHDRSAWPSRTFQTAAPLDLEDSP